MKFNFSSIELKNFRQYRGTQVLDFSFNSKKNVIIVQGKNGAGKSNLLNALTWCFYGLEAHSTYEDNERMPIINTTELANLKSNQRTSAEVIIHLETDNGPWTIKRSIGAGKKSNGDVFFDQDSTLTVIRPIGGQDEVVIGKDTEVLINNFLPADLRSFFFMDGEKLREFFNKDTIENIGSSIEKVSQLELLYNAGNHLELYEKEVRKGVKESTPKLDEINTGIIYLEKRINELKENIEKNKTSIRENRKELQEKKDFLKTCGIDQVENLEKERQSIETDIVNYNVSLSNLTKKRNQYLVEIAPFIMLKKPIEESMMILSSKIEKGELPPKIKETLVRELIQRGECICRTKIEGPTKAALEEYCAKLTLSELGDIAIIGKTKFKDILDEISQFPQKIDTLNNEINELGKQLEAKVRRKQQIKEEMDKVEDKNKIILYEQRREELEGIITRLKQRLKGDDAELVQGQKDLMEKRTEYEKELGSSQKNQLLKSKLKIVTDSLTILADVEVKIKEMIRKQIQLQTEKNFFKLIRKKGAFTNVIISEKYYVIVKHESGYNVIDHLSAGEYMILGLSFMSALMNISGFKAPVIIDTPLGKIDDEHRNKITSELPVFLEGTQLILFVTPTEFDPNVKSNLSHFITKGNMFEIIENEKQNESQVIKND